MPSLKENAMTKEMREVGDWQTKILTYTHARQEEGMGVTVPEVSLSVQRIFFIQSYFPTSICLLFCSVPTYHPWLSSSPSKHWTHIQPYPSRERLLHLKGRLSSYLLLLLRSSAWWHEFFIFSSCFLSFSSPLCFLLRYCQQKLEMKNRTWEEKEITPKMCYSLLYSWAYFVFLFNVKREEMLI